MEAFYAKGSGWKRCAVQCGFGMKIRGYMGIADFMEWMGGSMWGNYGCKRFISFVHVLK